MRLPDRVLTTLACSIGLWFTQSLAVHAQSRAADLTELTSSSAEGALLLVERYGQLPLTFEPNQGQAQANVRFVSRSSGQLLLLEDKQAVLLLSATPPKGEENPENHVRFSTLQIRFAGASHQAEILPLDLQPGKSNYLLGNDATKWHTKIANYSRVLYRSLYPGVDLVFYGNQRHLEHDFIIAPGADFRQILLDLRGSTKIQLRSDGSVEIATRTGPLQFSAPRIYQVHDGNQVQIAGGFRVLHGHQLAFDIKTYDKNLPLIIDPVLSYSTYLAGSQADIGVGIAVDANQNAYVAGYTVSPDFPATNTLKPSCANCPANFDVFVLKLNPTGTGLVYSTVLGGTDYDQATAIALAPWGSAVVTGRTSSNDFPTKNPIQTLSGPGMHGFVSSLTHDGSSFNFSTYLGGNGFDNVSSLTTDRGGNLYVAGTTSSSDFPISPATNVIGLPPGNFLTDMFVAKLSPTGALLFATAIGPSQSSSTFFEVNGGGLAVGADGSVYLGGAASGGFPVTPGAFQTIYQGPPPNCGSCTMGFVSKIKPDGSAFVYASYLGGSQGDQVTGLAADTLGNAFVTGNTFSTDFPTTPGAFQSKSPSGGAATFVTKMDPTGSALVYSTFLGGSTNFGGRGPTAMGIAINASGESFVTGFTSSSDFPLKNPLQTTIPPGSFGNGPATYLTKLNVSGTELLFSTLFSGSVSTQAAAVALDPANGSGGVYITGTSFDTDLPTTPGAFQTTVVQQPPFTQPSHAFVTKFDLSVPSPAVCANRSTLFLFASVGTDSFPTAVNLVNCGNAPLKISHMDSSDPFKETDNCQNAIPPGQSCTMNVVFHPTARGFFNGTVTIFDNAPIQPLKIRLHGQGVAPVVQLSTSLLRMDDQLVGHQGLGTPLFVFNQGDDVLQISSTTVVGKDFTQDNSGCVAPIQPGNGCAILVFFRPIAAGLRSGTLTLSDNALDSPQVVTLQGTGLTAYLVPTISSVSPSALLQDSVMKTITVSGTGFFQASKIRINGTNVPTTYNGETSLSADLPATFLRHIGELEVEAFTPVPGGGLSNSVRVLIYQVLSLGARDLIYEPYTRRLYASIASDAALNSNTIVSIDPSSQSIGPYVPIGNGPNKLGLSENGELLYVGLDGDHIVQQFKIRNGKLGSHVALPIDPLFGQPMTANDIVAVPGRPEDYVLGLRRPFVSPSQGGVALVSSGSLLSTLLNAFPSNVDIDHIRFLAAPNTFYGFDGLSSFQFSINQTTLSFTQTFGGDPGLGEFESDGRFFYSHTGLVFDPTANQVVGNYQFQFPGVFNPAVLPESSLDRTYFLTLINPSLIAFDQKTFAPVDSVTLPQNFFETLRLVRWGQDGFAFLSFNFSTSSSDVILLRSHLAEPSVGPNPRPMIKFLSPEVREHHGNFQLTVRGTHFVPGAVVRWNGSDRTTIFQSDSVLIADIPASDVREEGRAEITVFNPPKGGGESNELNYHIREIPWAGSNSTQR